MGPRPVGYALTSNQDMLVTAKTEGRSRMGQPSRLPVGWMGTQYSKLKTQNSTHRESTVNSRKDDWRPTATLEALKMRAEILSKIRAFFADRGVLEVETPLLASAPVTDLHLHALSCRYRGPGCDDGRELYLQTSPEFAMKRLLAAGSGPIFELCKAVRDGEAGRRHNPEFTILEWYRPGWDHHRLMDEVDELLGAVLGSRPGERLSYAAAFRRYAEVDPHDEADDTLRERVLRLGVSSVDGLRRDDLLDLILTHVIEPRLGHCQPTFIDDYPASQAALARIRPGNPPLAERFEVFVEGLELANGYHELTDPARTEANDLRTTSWRDAAPVCLRSPSTSVCWHPSSTACRIVPASPSASTGW